MSPLSLRTGGRHQRGQALVLSLFTVGIVVLVMFTMYSTGWQTIAKIKLQNTADAAAYSAALAQARDYNFSAYTNRAMVANQVAVAQMVGLTSWARNYRATYHGTFSDIPKVLLDFAGSPLRSQWAFPWNLHKSASNAVGKALDKGSPKIVLGLDKLIDALGDAQKYYHYGTGLTIAQTVGLDLALLTRLGMDTSFLGKLGLDVVLNDSNNIIKLNDTQASLSPLGIAGVLIGLAQWYGFTEQKDPNVAGADGPDADRFAKVTIDSADRFFWDRSTGGAADKLFGGTASERPYLPPWAQPFLLDPTRFVPYQNGMFLMWLWHRGGTELKDVGHAKRTWSALDATGFTAGAIYWVPTPWGFPFPIPIIIPTMPMGWGAAQAGGAGDLSPFNDFRGAGRATYGAVYRGFNTAAPAAIQMSQGPGTVLGTLAQEQGGGLRKYFDVKDITKDNLVAPALVIEVEKDGGDVPSRTSGQASSDEKTLLRQLGSGVLAPQGTQSGKMRALSKAQAYFSRPQQRDDQRTELGSLYSPYWQARLVANNRFEQYLSIFYHLQ